MVRHKVFISYQHQNDQFYKEKLLELNNIYQIFIDGSVDTGDIDEDLSDKRIREIIRDDYLKDTTVTILLVGLETKKRKHIDWEIYSSMYNGKINKQSGIIVINLPITKCTYYTAGHGEKEKEVLYPKNSSWMTIDSRSKYNSRYPYLPERIIDNLLKKEAKISVINWDDIKNNAENLRFLINITFEDKGKSVYDLSRPMKRKNS